MVEEYDHEDVDGQFLKPEPVLRFQLPRVEHIAKSIHTVLQLLETLQSLAAEGAFDLR